MRTLHLSALSLMMLILAGCSSMGIENKRVDYKSAANRVPSLEIPPDLTRPQAQDHYIIPDSGDENVASYSDYAKSGASQKARGAAAVLPEAKNVRLEHSGTQHWLVVDDKAENVWPVLKAFWQENGFVIKVDNPEAGVMETDWAENRAKIPQGLIRSVIGKVFENMYSSGEQDMYRTRLERSKDGLKTEIYITLYGKEEVLSEDKRTTKWQSRPNDPEMEAIMLQMLMVKLGGEQAKAQMMATRAAAGGPAEPAVAAPKLQTLANGSKVILLSEPFDKSWRKVGLALERAGFGVDDKDRNSGVYFVFLEDTAKEEKGWLDKLAFWRSNDTRTKSTRYQVSVHESGGGCEVAVNSDKADKSPAAQKIIDALYKNLSK